MFPQEDTLYRTVVTMYEATKSSHSGNDTQEQYVCTEASTIHYAEETDWEDGVESHAKDVAVVHNSEKSKLLPVLFTTVVTPQITALVSAPYPKKHCIEGKSRPLHDIALFETCLVSEGDVYLRESVTSQISPISPESNASDLCKEDHSPNLSDSTEYEQLPSSFTCHVPFIVLEFCDSLVSSKLGLISSSSKETIIAKECHTNLIQLEYFVFAYSSNLMQNLVFDVINFFDKNKILFGSEKKESQAHFDYHHGQSELLRASESKCSPENRIMYPPLSTFSKALVPQIGTGTRFRKATSKLAVNLNPKSIFLIRLSVGHNEQYRDIETEEFCLFLTYPCFSDLLSIIILTVDTGINNIRYLLAAASQLNIYIFVIGRLASKDMFSQFINLGDEPFVKKLINFVVVEMSVSKLEKYISEATENFTSVIPDCDSIEKKKLKDFSKSSAWSQQDTLQTINLLLFIIFPSFYASIMLSEIQYRFKKLSSMKLAKQFLLKVMHCFSNEIWNANNSNLNQFLHVQVDVEQVVESVYNNILQEYETVQAMQAALATSNAAVIDRLAKEMTCHLQVILLGEVLPESDTSPSTSVENIVDEVLGNVFVHSNYHTLSMRNKEQSTSDVYSASFLEDIIAELLTHIILASNIMDDINERKSEFELMELAVELVNLLLGELKDSDVKVVSVSKEALDHLQQNMKHVNKVVNSVYCDILKDCRSYRRVRKYMKHNRNMLAGIITSFLLAAMHNYQIQPCLLIERSPFQYTTLNPSIILRKFQTNVKNSKHKRRYLVARKTVLSSKVLEDIIARLISKIFPSSGDQISFSDSEFKHIISKLVTDVMIQISQHEIWDTPHVADINNVNAQKDVPHVVDLVYNNVLDKYGSHLAVQDMITYRSKSLVKSVSRFVVREISNPNFVAVSAKKTPSLSNSSAAYQVERVMCGLHEPQNYNHETGNKDVYSSFLLEIISGILLKIFTFSDQITREIEAKKSEMELNNEVSTLVNSVLMEIRHSQIKVNYPDINKHVLDGIVNSIFSKIYSEHETNVAVFTSLTRNTRLFAEKIVCLIKEAIADYQLERHVTEDISLCSYTSLDASKIVSKVVNSVMKTRTHGMFSLSHDLAYSMISNNAATSAATCVDDLTSLQYETSCLKSSSAVLSSTVIEEVVVRFLATLFLNVSEWPGGREVFPPFSRVKRMTEILSDALLNIIMDTQIQVRDDSGKLRLGHEKDFRMVENVVDVVYLNICRQFRKSYISVFENLLRNDRLQAHTISELMIAEICNSSVQHLYSHCKFVPTYVSIESSYIAQRVINIIQEIKPHSLVIESQCHELCASLLEEIVSQLLTKMVTSTYLQAARHRSKSLETEINKIASKLMDTVLHEIAKPEPTAQITLKKEQCLKSEDCSDTVAVIVNSIYMNALHEIGYPTAIFKAMATGCNLTYKTVAGLVVKEICTWKCKTLSNAITLCDLYTDIEVDKIVNEVLNDITRHSLLCAIGRNNGNSVFLQMAGTPEEDKPVGYIKNELLKNYPPRIADYFSVQTQPLPKPARQCFSQPENSLSTAFVLEMSMSGKTFAADILKSASAVMTQNGKHTNFFGYGSLDGEPTKVSSMSHSWNIAHID